MSVLSFIPSLNARCFSNVGGTSARYQSLPRTRVFRLHFMTFRVRSAARAPPSHDSRVMRKSYRVRDPSITHRASITWRTRIYSVTRNTFFPGTLQLPAKLTLRVAFLPELFLANYVRARKNGGGYRQSDYRSAVVPLPCARLFIADKWVSGATECAVIRLQRDARDWVYIKK